MKLASTLVVAALLSVSLALSPVAAGDHPYEREPDSKSNGVVMMVHGHTDPDPLAPTPAPPVHEAVVANRENGSIRLALIPYSPDANGIWRPRNLSGANPILEIEAPGFDDVEVAPNVDPSNHSRCVDETTIEGHGGPLSACLVFELPAETFDGRNAPALKLHWDGGIEAYNVAAHALMHDRFEGGPVPVEDADRLTGQPTPFAVQSLVDPVD